MAIGKNYVKCPDCGATGFNKNIFKITDDDGIGGCYPSCETCHGTGILEKIVVPDEEEVDGHMECISDVVNEAINVKADPTNPDHYKNRTSLECIEAMEIIFGKAAVLDFCACNAWKYIWRWKNKNGLEDLEKAKWYVDKAKELIDRCAAEEHCVTIGYNRTLKEIKNYIHRQQEKKVCEEGGNE